MIEITQITQHLVLIQQDCIGNEGEVGYKLLSRKVGVKRFSGLTSDNEFILFTYNPEDGFITVNIKHLNNTFIQEVILENDNYCVPDMKLSHPLTVFLDKKPEFIDYEDLKDIYEGKITFPEFCDDSAEIKQKKRELQLKVLSGNASEKEVENCRLNDLIDLIRLDAIRQKFSNTYTSNVLSSVLFDDIRHKGDKI